MKITKRHGTRNPHLLSPFLKPLKTQQTELVEETSHSMSHDYHTFLRDFS